MEHTSTKQSGFTLVELIIIVPVAMLTVMAVVAALIALVSDNITTRGELAAIHDAQTALNTIEDDARFAAAFMTVKDSAFSDPYGPDNAGAAWSFAGSSADVNTLIMRNYATTADPKDSQKQAVYINQKGCAFDVILGNPPLTTNIIYFVRNNKLYRRILTDTSQTLCNPQFQRQSCPPDRSTNNAICRADDMTLMGNVTKFKVEYYADPLSTTPIDTSSALPSTLAPAIAVKITLKVEHTIAGQFFSFERTILITKQNT
ncbi:MAG TPA: hypothetical protein VFZ48_01890 [Candidatus Saccharimonadales bacterium]